MEMETGFLQYTMELLKTSYAKELELLKIKLPDVTSIPRVRFDEAKQRVAEKYNRQFRNPFDLEPEEEVLIGQYFKEEYGSDFVFVTHYPSKKRPFYAMDDPADETYTLSFDLLFRGLEITTGGQRIHDYNKLMEKSQSVVWRQRAWRVIFQPLSTECRHMEVLESDLRDLQCSLSEKTMCVRPHCFLVISADWSHRSQLLGCDGCACRLCGGICVYILFRKFLSLFRHSLRIGYWQEVCCEVLQAVSVGIVKNLSSQYIYPHALQSV